MMLFQSFIICGILFPNYEIILSPTYFIIDEQKG